MIRRPSDIEPTETARQVWRGVFKPRRKAFGFEGHLDHIGPMQWITAADCQMNYLRHERFFLPNTADKEIHGPFNGDALQNRTAARLSEPAENLFFEETEERFFRN